MNTRDLKHDALGTTRLVERGSSQVVERDTRTARFAVRWLARWLAAREAAALTALAAVDRVPKLLEFDGAIVRRSYVPGAPLYEAPPRSPLYFVNALRLLRALHRAGVAHNDLAKEANWLVSTGDVAGIVDFQLAICSRTRGRWFRRRAYEDLRRLLKPRSGRACGARSPSPHIASSRAGCCAGPSARARSSGKGSVAARRRSV